MSSTPYTVLLSLAAAQSFALLPSAVQSAIVRRLQELAAKGGELPDGGGASQQVIWADMHVFYRVERAVQRIVVIAADER